MCVPTWNLATQVVMCEGLDDELFDATGCVYDSKIIQR